MNSVYVCLIICVTIVIVGLMILISDLYGKYKGVQATVNADDIVHIKNKLEEMEKHLKG